MQTSNKDLSAPLMPPPALGAVLTSLALCVLLPSLGTSIANVALPSLAQSFAAPFQKIQWVVLAYLLAVTTLIVGAGRLGDIWGRQRLLRAGILVFTAASALCALAPTLELLLAARALQGVGAAAMTALTMAFVADAVPKARTGATMGLLGAMSATGTALGPTLGGLLIAYFGWPAIFWVLVPLVVLAWVLVRHTLPADRSTPSTPRQVFDLAGTLLLGLTLAAYALAVTTGRGHFGLANLLLLGVAALGAIWFTRVEARAVSPLVRLAKLREPVLRNGLATNALVSTVMMATLMVGPFYLARTLGLDTALAGAAMSAGPVVSALAGVPAGRLVDRWGSTRISHCGLGAMLAGCIALCLAPSVLAAQALAGLVAYLLPLAVLTAGYALFQAANNTAVMREVPSTQRGVVSGMLNLSRNLGLLTGASVLGAVFSAAASTGDLATASPAAVAFGMQASFGVAAALVAAALLITRAGAASVAQSN
jgi:MFS family permease